MSTYECPMCDGTGEIGHHCGRISKHCEFFEWKCSCKCDECDKARDPEGLGQEAKMKPTFGPQWVECNLPWYVRGPYVTYPNWPSEETPENIEAYNKEINRLNEERNAKVKELSFIGKGLAKPGTLIEVEDDSKINQYLIGHINDAGGICEDCMMFPETAIVKRYKVLLEE